MAINQNQGEQPQEPQNAGFMVSHAQQQLTQQNFGGGMNQEQNPEDIDFREYWYVLLKRRWTILTFFVIVVVAVTVGTLLQTPIFRSTATVQIERDVSQVLQFKDAAPEERTAEKDFYVTQYELLKSHSLAQRVIEELHLNQAHMGDQVSFRTWITSLFFKNKSQTKVTSEELASKDEIARIASIKRFLGNLTIEPVRNSRLVKISYDSPSAKLSADAANSVAENFIKINLEKKFQANAYAKKFLEDRIAEVKVKLEEAERAQVDYARTHKIFTLESGPAQKGETRSATTTSGQNMQEFNSALIKLQQDRIKAEAIYNQVKNNKSAGLPQQLENELIKSLKQERAKREADYQDKLKTFKPGYPAMQQIRAQIDELTEQINQESENIRQSIRIAYETAKANESMISSKLDTSREDLLDVQGRSIQFNILRRDADTNRQLYEGLLQRLKEVSASEGNASNNIMVVDHSEIPAGKYKPDLKINLLIALFIGLFGGVGLAFLFEQMDNTFKNIAQIERFLGVPVLGLIPDAEEIQLSHSIIKETLANSKSKIVEAFRSTRTALQFSTPSGAPKVLGMTSCFASEGKTTASISLAIHFAQCGSSVLLIDADLRKPAVHKAFEIENEPGLSNILAGLIDPSQAIVKTPIENLSLLPSGAVPPNPAELMMSGRFEEFIASASKKYDLVLIDGPPILGLADAVVIANLVEKLLLVVEAGVTPRTMARAALRRLTSVKVKPLGVIFNKMKNDPLGYGYDYYYYYAHGYYGYGEDGKKNNKNKPKKSKFI